MQNRSNLREMNLCNNFPMVDVIAIGRKFVGNDVSPFLWIRMIRSFVRSVKNIGEQCGKKMMTGRETLQMSI